MPARDSRTDRPIHTRLALELAPRPFAELSAPEQLAVLWERLPGHVAAVARRDGRSPQRVLEILSERLPADREWWGGLADFDSAVRASLEGLS